MTNTVQTYKLFIDDERWPVTPDWLIARTSREAIIAISHYGVPSEIAFDHDLGGDDTAIPVIHWLEGALRRGDVTLPENFSFYIHSQNPVGARRIKEMMDFIVEEFGSDD